MNAGGETTEVARVLPAIDDHDTHGFWDLAREGTLGVRFCANCASVCHIARPRCTTCASWNTVWKGVSGEGTVYSWTVVRRQVHPSFAVPYTLVLVELSELPAVRLVGRVSGAPDLVIGQPMRVRFERVDDSVSLPVWDVVEPTTE